MWSISECLVYKRFKLYSKDTLELGANLVHVNGKRHKFSQHFFQQNAPNVLFCHLSTVFKLQNKIIKMVVDKSPLSGNVLEQFVLLAKTAKGAACTELVRQVLEAPGVYVFGELLDMPNIVELSTTDKKFFNTLELFAFGTFKDDIAHKNDVLELSLAQKKKLQHLTIVTLATKSKCIPYNTLLIELDIKNVRDLEDLIIEAIYADIIHGKLDQKNSQLEVDYAVGRDIRAEDINIIVNCLQDWCSSCEGVLSCVENQIHRANSEKNRCIQRKADIENEIVNIKKTLKTQLQERSDGTDEVMATDSRESASSGDKGKKSQKMKGLKILR